MRAPLAILLLLWCASVRAQEPYQFLGPAPARNFQPIQLIFLQLPFERAATVGTGELAIQLNSAESNEIEIVREEVNAALKFETNRTVVGLRYGLLPHWEVGIDVPFISRFGGFLDPLIDEVEYVFGLGNAERDEFSNNTFGAFFVERDGVLLFEGEKETLALGDLWFSAKREFPLRDGLPVLALRAAVKAPTGSASKVTGSGNPDVGFGLAVEHRLIDRLMVYLNLDLVYPFGFITPGRLALSPSYSESFALELALTRRLSGVLHQALYTSPMGGTGARLLDDDVVEIGLGLNFAWSERWGFQLLGINNVSPVEQAADFSALIAVTFRLGGAERGRNFSQIGS